MVSDPATRQRLAAAAEGSVRAEGLNPSARTKELVAEVMSGATSAADARRELLAKYTSKARRP
jgi:hypothetical protein